MHEVIQLTPQAAQLVRIADRFNRYVFESRIEAALHRAGFTVGVGQIQTPTGWQTHARVIRRAA